MDTSLSDSVSPHVPTHDRKGREGKGVRKGVESYRTSASCLCRTSLIHLNSAYGGQMT